MNPCIRKVPGHRENDRADFARLSGSVSDIWPSPLRSSSISSAPYRPRFYLHLGACLQRRGLTRKFTGDEGGIVCHIVPEDGRNAIIVSLTHVRMHSPPFATAVFDYQKHRVKKLKKQSKT